MNTKSEILKTTSSILANYRLYDRTGGGGTEDIIAESLEDAIQQGREWIEAGDWSGDDGVYRTITLECSVREIVRYPSPDANGKAVWHDGTELHADEDGDLIDAEGCLYCTAADCGEIDEDATSDNDAHDCSGEYSDALPECEANAEDGGEADIDADSDGHDWRSPHSLVGGLKENPGYWSGGGTITISKSVCACCGCYKTETDKGQCHESESKIVIEIAPRDTDSEAWLKRIHADDDGWLPQWLAEYLDCPPTTRMTEDEAKEYVSDHSDDDELDKDDLEHAFAAIFGRRANDQDRAEGLWSHVNAAV